jgi:dTMP kinase
MVKKGSFVTFDGPNGVGKTSVFNGVADQLHQNGFEIVPTKEPTNSSLGRFILQAEESYSGRTLASLVAADRYFHLDNEVLPALRDGKIVLSDRYIESPLVLQRLDDVEVEFVWTLNSQFYVQDLSVILTASPKILKKRLAQRVSLGRFERTRFRAKELQYYLETVKFLSQHGFNILLIDNENVPLQENVYKVTKRIIEIAKKLRR